MQRRPITQAGVDRAVQALERLLEAPDAAAVLGAGQQRVWQARDVLLRCWSSLDLEREEWLAARTAARQEREV